MIVACVVFDIVGEEADIEAQKILHLSEIGFGHAVAREQQGARQRKNAMRHAVRKPGRLEHRVAAPIRRSEGEAAHHADRGVGVMCFRGEKQGTDDPHVIELHPPKLMVALLWQRHPPVDPVGAPEIQRPAEQADDAFRQIVETIFVFEVVEVRNEPSAARVSGCEGRDPVRSAPHAPVEGLRESAGEGLSDHTPEAVLDHPRGHARCGPQQKRCGLDLALPRISGNRS